MLPATTEALLYTNQPDWGIIKKVEVLKESWQKIFRGKRFSQDENAHKTLYC
jgi:hypothetical protein